MISKIGLCGASGRMGKAIQEKITDFPELSIQEIFPKTDKEEQNLEKFFRNTDIVIDFSTPQILSCLIEYATKFGNKLVIGTTGFDQQQFSMIEEASEKIPIFYSANMSIGINLLSYLVGNIARNLDESYDIDIIDTHHRHKKDQPSGTAITLQKAIAAGRDLISENIASSQYLEGKGTINISSIRSGNIIGEHEIIFAGEDEVIKIKHQAQTRDLFANGALRAAMWIRDQSKPGFYSMMDMLKFK